MFSEARRHGGSRRRARQIQSAAARDAAGDGRCDGWARSGHGGARQRADGTCSRRRSSPKSEEDEPRNLLLLRLQLWDAVVCRPVSRLFREALTAPFLALLPALRLLLLRHPRPEGGGCLHAFGPDHRCWLCLPFTSFLPHQAFSPVASSGSLLYLWIETGPPPAPIPSSSSSTSSPAVSAAHPPKALAVCNPLAGTYGVLTSPWTTLPRNLLPPPPSPSLSRPRPHPLNLNVSSFSSASQLPLLQRVNALVADLDTMQKLADGCNIQVPMEVVNLIDDGKNPDEFTRDVLNSCIAKNQITKGKTDAFKSLRKHLLEELEEAFPDDVEAYRQIRATSATESKRLAQSQSALPNGDASETRALTEGPKCKEQDLSLYFL
ncbi:Mediator of RNA polymerase II transcription subunit 10 [Hordeum vulgare]|nr:Mediator of RNA polymerase II transcription subunit 10 [Hordeum vulgare]